MSIIDNSVATHTQQARYRVCELKGKFVSFVDRLRETMMIIILCTNCIRILHRLRECGLNRLQDFGDSDRSSIYSEWTNVIYMRTQKNKKVTLRWKLIFQCLSQLIIYRDENICIKYLDEEHRWKLLFFL